MNKDSERALQDIPNLILFADKLINLADSMTQKVDFGEENHLALMSLCFVSKQIEHLKSIRILVESVQYRDAGLIARSMIEGLCLLLWAAREPQKRPFQWKSYAWVEDYKLLLKKELAGERVDPAIKTRIIEQLRIYGTEFLKKNKKTDNFSDSHEDPYRSSWTNKNVYEICKEVGGDLLYEKIYRDTSQWIHWTVKGMSSAISRDDVTFKYTNTTAEMGATALASGFQSLFQSAKLLNDYFGLGFDNKLKKLQEEYHSFHKKT